MTPGFKPLTAFTDILSNTLNRERLMTPKILNTKPVVSCVSIPPLALYIIHTFLAIFSRETFLANAHIAVFLVQWDTLAIVLTWPTVTW